MGRARWWVGAVMTAGLLLGCHPHKEALVDAGSDGESEAALAASADAGENGPLELVADAETVQRQANVHCATGEVAVLLDGQQTCVVECKTTAECPPAWTCDAEGATSHEGRPGSTVHYCRNAPHGKPLDGGASRPAPDAGHAGPAPSGAPAKRLEHHDAGAKRL